MHTCVYIYIYIERERGLLCYDGILTYYILHCDIHMTHHIIVRLFVILIIVRPRIFESNSEITALRN